MRDGCGFFFLDTKYMSTRQLSFDAGSVNTVGQGYLLGTSVGFTSLTGGSMTLKNLLVNTINVTNLAVAGQEVPDIWFYGNATMNGKQVDSGSVLSINFPTPIADTGPNNPFSSCANATLTQNTIAFTSSVTNAASTQGYLSPIVTFFQNETNSGQIDGIFITVPTQVSVLPSVSTLAWGASINQLVSWYAIGVAPNAAPASMGTIAFPVGLSNATNPGGWKTATVGSSGGGYSWGYSLIGTNNIGSPTNGSGLVGINPAGINTGISGPTVGPIATPTSGNEAAEFPYYIRPFGDTVTDTAGNNPQAPCGISSAPPATAWIQAVVGQFPVGSYGASSGRTDASNAPKGVTMMYSGQQAVSVNLTQLLMAGSQGAAPYVTGPSVITTGKGMRFRLFTMNANDRESGDGPLYIQWLMGWDLTTPVAGINCPTFLQPPTSVAGIPPIFAPNALAVPAPAAWVSGTRPNFAPRLSLYLGFAAGGAGTGGAFNKGAVRWLTNETGVNTRLFKTNQGSGLSAVSGLLPIFPGNPNLQASAASLSTIAVWQPGATGNGTLSNTISWPKLWNGYTFLQNPTTLASDSIASAISGYSNSGNNPGPNWAADSSQGMLINPAT